MRLSDTVSATGSCSRLPVKLWRLGHHAGWPSGQTLLCCGLIHRISGVTAGVLMRLGWVFAILACWPHQAFSQNQPLLFPAFCRWSLETATAELTDFALRSNQHQVSRANHGYARSQPFSQLGFSKILSQLRFQSVVELRDPVMKLAGLTH